MQPNWSAILTLNSKHVPYSNLHNATLYVEHDPDIALNRLWFNEFSGRTVYENSPVREWRDDDDIALTVKMQETAGLLHITKALVADAVELVARRRARHPVCDWLTSLTWDGVERLTLAFEDYWGVELTERQPGDYVRAASRNFFISLVQRVLNPGCKVDTMPVFEGSQGIKKTSALEILGGSWFASIDAAVGDKDFLQALRGKWLIEIDELNAFSKTEAAHVKGMLSRRVDTYRPSYGRRTIDVPRQCVFAGTTNSVDWAIDDTGNRRFWPLTCGEIRIDLLRVARNQLFAEAVTAARTGESHWVMPMSAKTVQADRQPEHMWTATILGALSGQAETTMEYIVTQVLRIRLGESTATIERTVGSILRRAGWASKPARRAGKLGRIWFAPADVTDDQANVTPKA